MSPKKRRRRVIFPSEKTLAKLLPCPFCASKAEMLIQPYGWLVKCELDCGCRKIVYSNYVRQVISSWNQRIKITDGTASL